MASGSSPPGVSVGDYTVTDVIGSGSFATVYRGLHRRDGAQVAIKVIPMSRLEGGGAASVKALEAEIRLLREIKHPNIVRMLDVQRSAKYIFIVLEFCGGGDLTRHIRTKGPLREVQAQRVLRQLAGGLKHLWERQVRFIDVLREACINFSVCPSVA